MYNDLVSIIIPMYNRRHLIGETLSSLSKQSYNNWECIIVDDHSDDGSYEYVKEFISQDNRFSIHKRPENRKKGANACRNYGFDLSKGVLINWFDSDDIMDSRFLEEKVREITKAGFDAVISKTAMFKEDPTIISWKEKRTNVTKNCLEDFLELKVAWYLPDVLWKREFLNDKDLFNEDLMAGQDRDFHSRMLLHEPKLMVLDEYLTYCRKHDGNLTAKLDDIKNKALKISHMNSVISLVDKIDAADRLSKRIRLGLFKAMIKYLPYTLENKSDFNTLRSLLKRLSFPNLFVMLGWIKFYISYISIKLTGRGSKFLR
ncbi:MAG: glycosyltransferase family 2 protein [Flavobacteriaceae bacterium]|nr:MAG: glycosyltransferase family 2 protein [Flavobacteriaceae bacterium]